MCELSWVTRWERCVSGVKCQGGKGGRIVMWHGRRGGKACNGKACNEVAIWERWEGGGGLVSREGGIEFKDKFVLHCSREAKCKQEFTAGIL